MVTNLDIPCSFDASGKTRFEKHEFDGTKLPMVVCTSLNHNRWYIWPFSPNRSDAVRHRLSPKASASLPNLAAEMLMCARKMHANKIHTDASLVRRLLAAQFPHWADLPIERIRPRPGAHNFGRGVPLAIRDADTRAAIAKLDNLLDTGAVTAAWDADLNAPAWDRPPVWIHGDLHAGNLLVDHGRLSAVIDFGGLGVGDPACDFAAAWTLFSHESESRDAFRAALSIDDASWARSRGWALSTGLIALPYYLDTNPVIVAMARRQIDEVLADRKPAC